MRPPFTKRRKDGKDHTTIVYTVKGFHPDSEPVAVVQARGRVWAEPVVAASNLSTDSTTTNIDRAENLAFAILDAVFEARALDQRTGTPTKETDRAP